MTSFPLWAWFAFSGFIVAMLLLDLFVLHRGAKEISFREAALLSAFWVTLGLGFGVFVWLWAGPETGGEYFAGYVIEKALSVDNVFVFALIFTYFAVPPCYQYRVLLWGVVGALVLRGVFILLGAGLLERYEWMAFVFGAFLVYTGIRMARRSDEETDPESNPLLRILRRVFPVTDGYRGQSFFVRENGVLMATPLFAVLVAIESTDLVFALDSIPAIFAITREPFVVYTSNAFAILGLRALYFMLADLVKRFVYLKVGLSLILVFVGVKFALQEIVGHLPVWVSLAFISVVVTASIAASLYKTRGRDGETG
ncbi:MAG: TerC family protein [Rubrobacter sp.]|nr:TerC family protein [Rubrobacter sp.]